MASSFTDADVERALGRATTFITELPGVTVGARHGQTSYLLRDRAFAQLVVDHHGDGRLAFWLRATKDEQTALVAGDPDRYFAPPYLGPKGWIGALADAHSEPDWDEIASLFEQAWRMGATRKAVAALDERRAVER